MKRTVYLNDALITNISNDKLTGTVKIYIDDNLQEIIEYKKGIKDGVHKYICSKFKEEYGYYLNGNLVKRESRFENDKYLAITTKTIETEDMNIMGIDKFLMKTVITRLFKEVNEQTIVEHKNWEYEPFPGQPIY